MPMRNLATITIATIVSLLCYLKIERNRDAAIIAEAMHIIEEEFYEDVDRRTLFEGAMNGMVRQLDEHSAYFRPKQYDALRMNLDQEFAGIGIVVELNPDTKRLTVLSPLVGTPAHRAGMRAGDVILEIDSQNTEGMDLTDAVELMRGAKGEPVSLLVQHKGDEESVPFKIKRDTIPLESVLGDTRRDDGSWNYYLTDQPHIGYIRLTTFGDRTSSELRTAIEQFEKHPVDALILDLRGNAGGYLKTAVEVCDDFIGEKKVIVSTRRRGGVMRGEPFMASSNVLFDTDVPMVVLTNRYSASASEIVAACLQDHGRAVIVGERTWGKGTVQNIIKMEGGKSALKLTTASYWRPSEKNIHRGKDAKDEDDWGVRPNDGFEVKLSDEEFEKVVKARRRRDFINIGGAENNLPDESEDPKSDSSGTDPEGTGDEEVDEDFEDPQLKKAVDYLQEQIDDLPRGRKA